MKKYFALILALILLFSLVSCIENENDNFKSNYDFTDSDDSDSSSDDSKSNEALNKDDETKPEEYYFTAKIRNKSDSSMLLEVLDVGHSGLAANTLASIGVKEEYPNCNVGDRILVVFDGMIQESYPCQLPNVYSVTKVVK